MPPSSLREPGSVPHERIELWYARTNELTSGQVARLLDNLSPDEQARFHRYTVTDGAHAYLVAHAMLRAALSHFFGAPPAAWRFADTGTGKPVVEGPAAGALEFNLSHTTGFCIAAFTGVGPVGVDVESGSRANDILKIAGDQFTAAERARLAAASPAEREALAVWLWTAKEALVKASGQGLGVSLQSVSLHWNPEKEIEVASRGPELSGDWGLRRFHFDRRYFATVALPSTAAGVRATAVRFEATEGSPRLHPHACDPGPGGVAEITALGRGESSPWWPRFGAAR